MKYYKLTSHSQPFFVEVQFKGLEGGFCRGENGLFLIFFTKS